MERTFQDILRKIYTGTATAEDEKYYVDNFMSEAEKQIGKPYFKMNKEEQADYDAIVLNNEQGSLEGYDCPICKNKGYVAINNNGTVETINCDCISIRKTIRLMEKSGLGNLINLYSFNKWQCNEQWQKVLLDKSKAFLDSSSNWFYVGGNSGCGKSMICTCMAKEFMNRKLPVKYMLWLDESIKLKQAKNNAEEYAKLIDEIKNVQVLYIDDFLKVGKNEAPTTADINLAMEILNFRYVKAKSENKRYVTIISSERNIDEIISFDEATGSRIAEMTKPDYYIFISNDKKKNYRLK